MKKILFFIVIMTFSLAACGDAEVEKIEGEEVEDSNVEEDEAEETPEFYEANDTISVEGLEVTLNSITWGEKDEYSDLTNDKILRIELTAKNNSEENNFIDEMDFSIADAEGNMLEEYYGNDDANMFSHEIKSDKQAKGILEFDVPETENFELYYEPSMSFKDNAEVIWIIDESDIE